jgi:hypothetical protein
MENGEHDQHNCPHEPAEGSGEARLDRPNHYYHDIGCPFECTDRHNHPIKA